MIPAITDTNGAPSIYMPLSFIIIVTMVKDIYEDLKRFRYD
jgi:phospholipid-transporting ATPase